MKRQKISESEGTLDDFIDKLVSSPVQNPKSIKLELLEEETNNDTVFNVLIEIFSKTMKYIYGDRNGRVDLDLLDEEALTKMSKYFNSFGFNQFAKWTCNSGYQSVIIRGNEVKRGYSCWDYPLGTLDNFELFSSPQKCGTPTCVSSADSKIPKCK